MGRATTQARRDVEKANKEVANARKTESRLQVKLRKMELEIEGLKGKLRTAGAASGASSRPSSAASSRASSVASSRASSIGRESGRSASDRSRASSRASDRGGRADSYADRLRGFSDRYKRVAERRIEYSNAQRARSPREHATAAAYANPRPRRAGSHTPHESRPFDARPTDGRPPSRGPSPGARAIGGSARWQDPAPRGVSPAGPPRDPCAAARPPLGLDDAVRASVETRGSAEPRDAAGLAPTQSAHDIDARLGALQDYLRKNRYPMRD